MSNEIKDLVNKSIYWQKHSINKKYFFAQFDGDLLLLRLNNFPDEPLWTLIKQLEILDIEDTPETWVIDW